MQTVLSSSHSIRRALPALVALALLVIALAAPALAAAAPAPTKLTIATPLKVVPYQAAASFTGALTLDDVAGTPVDGYAVQFQRSYDTVTWTAIADVSPGTGQYSYQYATSFTPTRATWFRFSFAGDVPPTLYAPSVSDPPVKVTPRVSLTRPVAPSVVKARRAFATYGYLRPHHAAGAKYVKIRCYRRSASGSWVLKKVVSARDFNYKTWTKYKAMVSLPTAGKWKLVARYQQTVKFATTQSNPRYVTAK